MRTIQDRPDQFNKMVGHTMIMNEFKKRSTTLNFPSYMLMVGASGTGKSTSAFIIAKLLNCEHPVEVDGFMEPCNECKSCKDVTSQRFRRDIHYLDATYMGKEQVGSLRNSINSRPMYDTNKIFIIDEAHLLNSKEARGAMLTLTEKPKPNTYIMLCTTDASKFDTAFQSRFIKYLFREVAPMDIATYLYEVVKKEEIDVPDEFIEKSLFILSENCQGSLRLALQFLDRCIEGKIFTEKQITKEFGFVPTKQIYNMLNMLLVKDTSFFKVFDGYSDKDYIYRYINNTLLNTMKHKLDNTYIKNGYKKEASEGLIKKYPYELNLLNELFLDLNLKIGVYFPKNLFTSIIIQYFLKSNTGVNTDVVSPSLPKRRRVVG